MRDYMCASKYVHCPYMSLLRDANERVCRSCIVAHRYAQTMYIMRKCVRFCVCVAVSCACVCKIIVIKCIINANVCANNVTSA